MSDLVAFLNARLDEDEAAAQRIQAALEAGWSWTRLPIGFLDPERALREVEAKRKIIASQTSPYVRGHEPPTVVLKALAAVYSDHPDYQQEWAHGDS